MGKQDSSDRNFRLDGEQMCRVMMDGQSSNLECVFIWQSLFLVPIACNSFPTGIFYPCYVQAFSLNFDHETSVTPEH